MLVDLNTLTNFNNITDFGYRFIFSPATNGPGTPTLNNHYYTWFIGLGTEYAYNTYGAQFSLPRKTANPILSIRYLEDGGSWGGWTGIPASALATTSNTNIGADLSIGNGLIYFSKPGNSTGTIKLGLGGTTGTDDTTNMKIEINGVSHASAEAGNMIGRS
jgi:hypothetical protein